ncbi:MAG: hypothetical protein ACLGIN_18375 [Candidatus Sericytochromatia bacterium]
MSTLLDYKDLLRDLLEDPNDTRWPAADKLDLINRAMRDVVKRVQPLEAWVTLAQNGSSTSEYVMPSGTEMYAFKGHIQTDNRDLCPLTPRQAYARYGEDWDTRKGTPVGFNLGAFGRSVFKVIPDPGAALSDLKAWVSKYADALAADADVSELPDDLEEAVSYQAAFLAYQRDKQQRSPDKAQSMLALYEEQVRLYLAGRFTGFNTRPTYHNRSFL